MTNAVLDLEFVVNGWFLDPAVLAKSDRTALAAAHKRVRAFSDAQLRAAVAALSDDTCAKLEARLEPAEPARPLVYSHIRTYLKE